MSSRFVLVVALLMSACRADDPSARAATTSNPTTVVDSIFSVEEDIRRFKAARADVGARSLRNGSPTRDHLVERFVRALEQRDTIELRAMVIDAGEFIDLYYPSSMFSQPPYKQSPELRWFLMQENSTKGVTRLVRRYGGRETGFAGHECGETPSTEGVNKLWDRCVIKWQLQPRRMRVFSTIIERDGLFKFMSYANDL